MKKGKLFLDTIDRDLNHAARSLDRTSGRIRDAGLAPRRNIHRIGEALASIFKIQQDIYRVRPDLLPKFLADTKFGRGVLSYKRSDRSAARHVKVGTRLRRVGGRSTTKR